MTPRKIFAYLPVVIFLIFGSIFIADISTKRQAINIGYLDRAFPVFDQPPLAGMSDGFSSKDIKSKVVLINIFASWCSSCRAEHPMLMKLKDESPVSIFGVNWKDRPGAAKLYLEKYGNPYAGAGEDMSGKLGQKLGVTGVPETYLLDNTGRIRYRHIGPITEKVWSETLKPLIRELEART